MVISVLLNLTIDLTDGVVGVRDESTRTVPLTADSTAEITRVLYFSKPYAPCSTVY